MTLSPNERFELSHEAPNLTVNGPFFHPRSKYLAVVVSSVQMSVIATAGLLTFHYKLWKTSRPFSPLIAYILFTVGMYASDVNKDARLIDRDLFHCAGSHGLLLR